MGGEGGIKGGGKILDVNNQGGGTIGKYLSTSAFWEAAFIKHRKTYLPTDELTKPFAVNYRNKNYQSNRKTLSYTEA